MLINYNLYDKARQLYKNRQFDAALTILEEINKDSPGTECIEFTIAKIKARNKKTIDEAKEIFLKLLNNNNQYVSNALFELGRIEVIYRNYDRARSYFNKLIKRENDCLAYIELAKLETKIGNHNRAIELLQTVDKNLNKESKYHYIVLLELAKASRRNEDIDKAKEYLKIIEEANDNTITNEWIMLEYSKIEELNNNVVNAVSILNKLLNTMINEIALSQLVKIYIKYEQYELAYKYNNELIKIKNPRSHFNPKQIDTFLKYKLGIENNEVENTYFTKQLYSYNKYEVINHISQHLDENDEKIMHSIYCEDINIEELYEHASKQIQNLEPIGECINDKYIVRCNKIVGLSIDKQPTDTIKVIVIPNTKNIITMYPIPALNNKLEIENNYTSSKQKIRESQIDKFNRRYAKNS